MCHIFITSKAHLIIFMENAQYKYLSYYYDDDDDDDYYYMNIDNLALSSESHFSHSPFQAMAYLDDFYEHASNVHLAE